VILVLALMVGLTAVAASAATVTARMRDGRTVVLYDAVVEQEAFNPTLRDIPLHVNRGGVRWDFPWYEVSRVDVLTTRNNVMTGDVTLVDGRKIEDAQLGRFTVIQGWAAPDQGGGLVTISTWRLRYAVFGDQLAPYTADAEFDSFEDQGDFDDDFSDDYSDDYVDDFDAEAPPVSCAGVIQFDFDRAAVRADQLPVLTDLADRLTQVGDRIYVVGHASSEGTLEYNQGLSERRAGTVVDELIQRGVAAERMEAAGAGETQPVADNSTAEGRALNRRVEVDC
jgi:outer membrane protein OmpA-like peptidoglycan-associated protein